VFGLTLTEELVFQFPIKSGLNHKCNLEKKMVRCDWVYSFLERNSNLSVLKAQCQSSASSKGLNKEVGKFCRHPNGVYGQRGLGEEHGRTFSVDDEQNYSCYSNQAK
jgi:hypothetical protein